MNKLAMNHGFSSLALKGANIIHGDGNSNM